MTFSRIQILTIIKQEPVSDTAFFSVGLPSILLETLVVDLSQITTLYFKYIYRHIHTV
jgi:hypothetical protein